MKRIAAIVLSVTLLFSNMAVYAASSPWDKIGEQANETKKDLEGVGKQAEKKITEKVASKAEISSTQMFIKTLENDPFSKVIDFEDREILDKALDTFMYYTYEKDTGYDPKVTEFAREKRKVLGFWETHAKAGPKAIIKNSYGTDIEFTADVYIHNSADHNTYDDAGLIFRVTDPKLGNQNLKGYYCAISDKNNEAKIGKFDNNYKTIKSAPIKIESGKWYRLKVRAIGDEISFYVNSMSEPVVQVKDSSYKGGFAGIRHFSIDGLKWTYWDNLALSRLSEAEKSTSKNTDGESGVTRFDSVKSVYSVNKDANVDINSDGHKEVIKYSIGSRTTSILYVNNEYKAFYAIPADDRFWIIDIDPNDYGKEIVVDKSDSFDKHNYTIYRCISDIELMGGGFSEIISFGSGKLTAVRYGEKADFKINKLGSLVEIKEDDVQEK